MTFSSKRLCFFYVELIYVNSFYHHLSKKEKYISGEVKIANLGIDACFLNMESIVYVGRWYVAFKSPSKTPSVKNEQKTQKNENVLQRALQISKKLTSCKMNAF